MKTAKTRITAVILSIMMCMMLCQGCSGSPVPDSHALTVDSSGVTGAGIKTGSTYAEWIEAYGDYAIQIYDGENFVPYTVEEEKTKGSSEAEVSSPGHDGRYMVAAFYVDDEPVSTDELSRSEGVEADALADHLASPEYLENHSVVFRYIIFTITDDAVSDIDFDYLDYNNEL